MAQKRLTEPRVTMELLAKTRSFSNLPAFLHFNDIFLLTRKRGTHGS